MRKLGKLSDTVHGPVNKNGDVLPIEGRGLSIEREGRMLLNELDLSLDGSATTVVMGPNGAGKSLAMRALTNLIAPDRGEVSWAGRAPDRSRAPRIGFLLQNSVMLRRSVVQNVEYALAIAGLARRRRREKARALLEMGGLVELERSPARVLSGGRAPATRAGAGPRNRAASPHPRRADV